MAKNFRKKKKINKKNKCSDKQTKRIALSLLFLTIILVGIFFVYRWRRHHPEPETFVSEKYFVKGIDVSHHNPILNWDEVHGQNITFAYLKATEGITHKDRNYIYNYELARKAGVKVGAYHFYTFGLSGADQAKHFIEETSFQEGDMIPAIDVEHSKGNPYNKDKDYQKIVVQELKALDSTLYAFYGVRPIIYTNKDCYKLYVKDNLRDNILWLSDLYNEPDSKIKNWRIWQFTHKGEIAGLPGENFDLNYYRYSYEQFKELLLP